ncbi:MAG: mannitol dehydrogenase family protein [Tessaracoccus sp.]|uniref:mannitol dehydrogenase family protein n=1 Tax=Tessaracoccus sp. TaxID=1971211 RepID=UPI001EC17C9E|nr:mannitol dehydrogenase family protein [Tessaracoccus sp.]MBK7822310.1 mannitol dehydrogenase family protein [Tessaracoccus sp.]
MTVLRPDALADLAIPVPAYDRAAVTPAIVHFGVGAFHRAHQALYLDRVLNAGDAGWGIVGVGLLPGDSATRDVAAEQGGLYTLTTLAPDGEAATRVVGSILDVVFGPDDPERVLALLSAPTTRIVSLTITEGGYAIDDATGAFAPSDPLTLADLDGAGLPRSAWGYLTEALRRRRAAGIAPFTVLSCDNVQGNGHVARLALTSFARHRDPELAGWIDAEVAFPSSMVDRITPVVTPEVARGVEERCGVEDRWPVQSESYLQWVLEDEFTLGRPPLDAVGVQLVDDVVPYERMKLRLLNASHQAMSYLGLLAGFTMVDEVCTDPDFLAFLRGYMRDEAIPTLGPVPGIDLDDYCHQLIARFASQAVRDTLARQVVDGSDRIPKFLLPVVREQLAAGGPIDRCATVLAGWGLYLEGHLVEGSPPLADRRAEELLARAALEQEEPGALLGYVPVFGYLGGDDRLRTAYLAARRRIVEQGARTAVR